MDHQLLRQHLSHLPTCVNEMLLDYTKHPTERNESYAVGYLCALNDVHHISGDTYDYLLAVVGQVRELAAIADALRSELQPQ